MTAPIANLRGLYGPTADQQAAALPEIGEGLAGQLESLSRAPEPCACEQLAANLDGARRAVLRLREALLREQQPDDAA